MTQKEIEKFLDNTKVYVNGKSAEIQKKLFLLGYRWENKEDKISEIDSPFLFIYDDKYITYSNRMDHFTKHKNREISAKEILSLELTEISYRPFRSRKECWNEMLKHQPFGWVKNDFYKSTISLDDNSIVLAIYSEQNFTYREAFEEFGFIDGTPFGIKEE